MDSYDFYLPLLLSHVVSPNFIHHDCMNIIERFFFFFNLLKENILEFGWSERKVKNNIGSKGNEKADQKQHLIMILFDGKFITKREY